MVNSTDVLKGKKDSGISLSAATLAYKMREEMQTVENKKCVVLLSGGLDSTTLMYSLIFNYEVWPVTISYGQRHSKEIMAARNVCEARGSWLLERWKLIDLSVLRSILPSALTGIGNVPEGHYESENQKATVVPNRNLILLSVAGGYAVGIGARYLAYAPHTGDFSIYPDCRKEFIDSARETLRLATGWNNDGLELLTPFSNMTKANIVATGKSLNVPYRLCWSCYNGKDRPCLHCGTCVERTAAFVKNSWKDPALTDSEWLKAVEYAKECGGLK